MKNNLDELLLVLETIRAEKHPEIPATVIQSIAEIQRDNQVSAAIRQGKIKTIVDQVTDKVGEV